MIVKLLKRMVDSWWKITLTVVVATFVVLTVVGIVVGPPPVKATADNAVKACRSSSYGPRTDLLGSRSSVKPDGTWNPREDMRGIYTLEQQVQDDSVPWICTAWMAKDGIWTVQWATSATATPLTWIVSNADLRSIAIPRDLSGPGHTGNSS